MIKSITFTENYDLSLEKEEQKRFPHRKIVPGKYDREKHPYHMFTLFPKDLVINFEPGMNVIVGENGSGKSTLLHLIKSYVGRPYKDIFDLHGTYKDEEDYIARYQDDYNGPLKVNGEINYTNTVFFDGEQDNPVIALPKMANPMSKDFNMISASIFFAQEESHGESMMPILDYILDNAKSGILFFDEPETALSLKNQIRLANRFKESADKKHNQIIISTHSLAIIKEFIHIFDMETRQWVKTNDYLNEVK